MSRSFKKYLSEYGLYLAWLVALLSTIGSLYFSEVAGYTPCALCWFQRMCMFPLAIILGMASYRGDKGITPYALVLAIVGFTLAAIQLLEKHIPILAKVLPCSKDVPCSGNDFNLLGVISIPILSLIAFVTIGLLLTCCCKSAQK